VNSENNEFDGGSDLGSPKEAEQKIAAAVHDAKEKVSDSVESAELTAEELGDAAARKFAAIRTKLREGAEKVRDNARDLRENAGERLKTYPIASVGVAFLAGVAIASLIRRRA
jgi:ElaB/YqjD/DUF883 family membrane-anchored ribosome-binding protein